ncbi:hepatoma-derived growth factor-related protein 2 [Agrilus planipennis]|uniref:Hepatoma-derived growth factor-related protein 2 n=1 Tax=Agrilus planipennis TaxID=224129 RepID=A0A1W4WMC7_AGRPL|nr:hepatoma-derived growth factor-related protein 2 [Agrilus planipennis]
MKKGKGFNVGDKVFAKVKGYPAWPARVVAVHGKRYQVQFYGTGETGTIKIEDLFYYLKHKDQFSKSLRRKDYNEAIEEIENAIKEDGTDGSSENQNESIDINESLNQSVPNSSLNESSDLKKSIKRKRPSSDDNQSSVKKISKKQISSNDNHLEESNSSLTSEELISQVRGPDDVNSGSDDDSKAAKNVTDKSSQNNDQIELSKENQKSEKNHDKTEKVTGEKTSPKKDKSKYKIVSDEHLKALIAYAEHVRKDPEKYKEKPPEVRSRARNEIVVAKQQSGQYICIKYNRDAPPVFKSEYEHAEYDENEAKTIISLKELVEVGSCNPEDDPKLFETNLTLAEEEIQESIELQILERKTQKLNFLKREQELVELDTKIKACLGLDEAEPKQALVFLDKILALDVDPLMLIKHPHVVDMVKRLRKYVGNTKEWNLSESNLISFQTDARTIREKATKIFFKFIKLLGLVQTDDKAFFDELAQKVEDFKAKTGHLKESEVFALCVQPDSRQAFLDRLDDEEEMKLINSKLDSKQEKLFSEKKNADQSDEQTLSNSKDVASSNLDSTSLINF